MYVKDNNNEGVLFQPVEDFKQEMMIRNQKTLTVTEKGAESRDKDSDGQNQPGGGIKSSSTTNFSMNEKLRKDEEQ